MENQSLKLIQSLKTQENFANSVGHKENTSRKERNAALALFPLKKVLFRKKKIKNWGNLRVDTKNQNQEAIKVILRLGNI